MEHKYQIGTPVYIKKTLSHEYDENIDGVLIVADYIESSKYKCIGSYQKRKWLLEHNFEYVLQYVGEDCGVGVLLGIKFAKETDICLYEGTNSLSFIQDALEKLKKEST